MDFVPLIRSNYYRDIDRICTVSGGPASHYLYAASGRPLAEHEAGTGAVSREYIWLNDMLVGLVQDGALYAVHGGHLGQPLLATDAAGLEVWNAEFAPYGGVLPYASSAEAPELRFPGQWADGENGLYQNWHRDYDPSLGRYIEADPLGLAAGQSLYGYVGGDPVNGIDPDGRDIVIQGDPPYVDRINRMLDKIGAADPQLGRRLDVLRNSERTHKIKLPNRSDGDRQAENKTDPLVNGLEISFPSGDKGECAPSTTLFDPGFDQGYSPESVLTHELLSHAYEKDQGIHSKAYEPGSTVRSNEERAVVVGDIYREAVGETLRESYDND